MDPDFVRRTRRVTASGLDHRIDQSGFRFLCTLLAGFGCKKVGRRGTLDLGRSLLPLLKHRSDEGRPLFLLDRECLPANGISDALD